MGETKKRKEMIYRVNLFGTDNEFGRKIADVESRGHIVIRQGIKPNKNYSYQEKKNAVRYWAEVKIPGIN